MEAPSFSVALLLALRQDTSSDSHYIWKKYKTHHTPWLLRTFSYLTHWYFQTHTPMHKWLILEEDQKHQAATKGLITD